MFLKLNEDDEVEQIREIGSTAAFLGQGESTAHFGLGLRGHEELLHKVTVRYFTQPEEVNNTTEETKLIEHNLEFFNIQPRSTLVVYKTDTAESLLGKNDVSNMKTFPVCDRVSSTSILLEEAKRARVTKKLSPGGGGGRRRNKLDL